MHQSKSTTPTRGKDRKKLTVELTDPRAQLSTVQYPGDNTMAKLIRLEDHPRSTGARSRRCQDWTGGAENIRAKIIRFPVFYPPVREEFHCGPPDELENGGGWFLTPKFEPYGES